MSTFEARLKVAKDMNALFANLRSAVEEAVAGGEDTIDVVKAAREAGIHVSADDLARCGVPQRIIAHPFLPWEAWFPWEALWSTHLQRSHPNTPGFVPGGLRRGGTPIVVPDPMP